MQHERNLTQKQQTYIAMNNIVNPEKCTTIDNIREQIDLIDKEIIKLFATRYRFVEKIVQFKSNEKEVVAQTRKDSVIEQRGLWAKEMGLNAEVFKNIYTALIDHNIAKELEILKSNQSK